MQSGLLDLENRDTSQKEKKQVAQSHRPDKTYITPVLCNEEVQVLTNMKYQITTGSTAFQNLENAQE